MKKKIQDATMCTSRKEIKYIVPLAKAILIKNSLNSLLIRDSNCIEGTYSVRSLYFDSVNNIDFTEKIAGVSHRKKIRIRIYDGDSSLCKLEIKEKHDDRQYKQSIEICAADVKALTHGNYSVLTKYFHNTVFGLKMYSIMEQGLYRPVVLVEYDRLAYRYPMYETRITIDSNIRATESNMDIFASEINYNPVLYENVVLEIKYSEKLMGFVSEVLAQFHLTQGTYSKYCSGRGIYYDFNY